MGVGKEDVRLGPIQDSFIIKISHNNQGQRITGYPLLTANQSWDSGGFSVDGYSDIDVFVLSDVGGTLYVHTGANVARVRTEVVANHYLQYPYVALSRPNTWRIPVRTKFARVVYLNGAITQTVWEVSIQLKPYGRS